MKLLISFSLCLIFQFSFAQSLLLRDNIPFIENGDTLNSPFAGGLNQPQFSQIELNGDGQLDLVVFDRSGDKVMPFLNVGGPGQIDYQFAPEYEASFPQMIHWMLTRDYNCDGKMDIFTHGLGVSTVAVYRNDSDASGLKFTMVDPALIDRKESDVIAVLSRDLPGIADVDGDGDLDILTFDFGGLYLEWYQNMSMENGHGCDSLQFEIRDNCWGGFRENGLDNTVTLQVSCKGIDGRTAQHSGSSVGIFDYEGDGVMEVVLGDIGAPNLVYLHNSGTTTEAEINAFSYSFPDIAPANVEIFPASFFLDIDLDGKDELIVAPNAPNISANFQNVWLYENIGVGDTNEFDFVRKNFLSDQMVECGMSSHPVFFDYNGDGLKDLVIGNNHYKSLATNEKGALTLYKNIGTAREPAFELITRDFLDLSSLFNPIEIGLVPAFGDMDGDGDEDMILGSSTGKLHYFQNNAVNDSAVLSLTTFNMFSLDVGQGSAPEIFDLNEDGLLDLIVGEQAGNFNYFENTGTAQAMNFSMPPTADELGGIDIGGGFTGFSVGRFIRNGINKPEFYVGGDPGEVSRYFDIQGRIFSTYFLANPAVGNINVGSRSSLDVVDLDDDFRYEFVVGNLRGGIAIYDAAVATSLDDPNSFSPSNFAIQIATNELSIAFPEKQNQLITGKIIDLLGRELMQFTKGKGEQKIVISHQLAPAVYIIQFSSEEQMIGAQQVMLR